MAILRGYSPSRTLELAVRAWDLGVQLVEVPIQSDEAVAALRLVVAAGRERGLRVGAGTVLDPGQVRMAAEAGAQFTVSPGLDPTVVTASLTAGLPNLPGVATASEIQLAQRIGVRWLKAFPASVLGPAWFQAMQGPFPTMNFVATGGISAANAEVFLRAGARVVAVGSALDDKRELEILAGLRR
ncbi:bifunctional 4-hydroxy-2-oxoglutarate aldolase/2-dehydro-3-deoxy-phosphogluconate aldolase [Jatrophihabitans telluris]|uniref:Bifunctional 4-hydroxy-2-oxoglutarate aldolase/2-dehydro-3-deoxy-phosphogluconate aldolase n=1 Tax=Jatrophihabitans telluris TaxID=2038343 RepID=A0ABY4QZX1_9ACTN|nr:bifunctional 4-hydroxy-2-oxoglutarate aldolase/2-dehydro-3-deoxy-phosphogluconate aldolase [Jatrophihabitans telluris]